MRWPYQLYVLLPIIWEHSQKGGLPLYLGNRLWDNDGHLVSSEKPATSHLLPHFHLQIETGNCSEFLRALRRIRRSLWLPPLTELSDNCSLPEHAAWVWGSFCFSLHQTFSYSVPPSWVMWFKLGLVKHLLKHHYLLVIKNVEIKEAMILPSWSQPCGAAADDSNADVTGLERVAHLSAHSPAADMLSLTYSTSEVGQHRGGFSAVQAKGQHPHLELGFDWVTVVPSVCSFCVTCPWS